MKTMSAQKSSVKPKRRRVSFSIDAPDAQVVCLAGTFNDWNPTAHRMKRTGAKLWQRTILLIPGEYEYKFVIDGRWHNDPANPNTVNDQQNGVNNVIIVE